MLTFVVMQSNPFLEYLLQGKIEVCHICFVFVQLGRATVSL